MKLICRTITPRSIFVLLDGLPPMQANDTHPNFNKIKATLDAGDYAALPDLFNSAKAISSYGSGVFEVRGNAVYIDGEVASGAIVQRILDAIHEKRDPTMFVQFQAKLKANPSFRIREQLFGFIENSQSIGLNDAGNIVAFKVVNRRADGSLVSIHDGTTRHDVGMVVSMPRSEVDDNPENTCSSGLHACSENYLKHFGGGYDSVVVAVEISPTDVVSVPTDYDNAKMRVCRYKVLSILGTQRDLSERAPDLDDFNTYTHDDDSGDYYTPDEAEDMAADAYAEGIAEGLRRAKDAIDEA